MRMVAEGVKTARSTVELAARFGIEMPIAAKMYSVLYEGLKPLDAISDLMERKLREGITRRDPYGTDYAFWQ